jgi:predicted nucleotidyltransferase
VATSPSAWRHEQVRPLLDAYAASDALVVALSGSAARGTADAWSDVEVLVVWEREPQRLAAGLAVPRFFEPDDEQWSDVLARDDLHVEVTHVLRDTVERRLFDFASGLVDAQPVKGADVVEEWRATLADYPRERQLAIVREHARIEHFWRWQMHRDRGNEVLAQAVLADALERMHVVRLALDELHGPKLKSAPPYAADPESVRVLVEETYDRIERELPEIDVDWLRRVFRHARRPVGP